MAFTEKQGGEIGQGLQGLLNHKTRTPNIAPWKLEGVRYGRGHHSGPDGHIVGDITQVNRSDCTGNAIMLIL
jgi:hypothetical protein